MLCAVDIGNTNIVLGIWDSEKWVNKWRLSTDSKRASDEYCAIIAQLFISASLPLSAVTSVIISNVVPPVQHTIERVSYKLFGLEPLNVGPGTKTGIKIRTDNPREVGADRIVNTVAAFRRYGGPSIVIDFGTATTFDCISAKGEYLGNAIAPGIGISAEALFIRASKLSRVELARPRTAIGRNTVESMQSGLIFGYAGLVDGMVERLKGELGADARVIATGGLARTIASETSCIEVIDSDLTLDGLRLVHELNSV